MACRNLLLRLEKAEHITLPPRQRKSPDGYRNRSPLWVAHRTEAIEGALKALTPLQIAFVVNASEQASRFIAIDRHVTESTRSTKGRRANERLWTVIATCALQSRSAFEFIREAVQAYFHNCHPPSLLPNPP